MMSNKNKYVNTDYFSWNLQNEQKKKNTDGVHAYTISKIYQQHGLYFLQVQWVKQHKTQFLNWETVMSTI